jgi:GH35 family endo-1,4-beta-xylanase
MNTITQIIALSATGANLIWHETQNDWVGIEQEVPNTDASELEYAEIKAEHYPAIIKVWLEVIDTETGQIVSTNI